MNGQIYCTLEELIIDLGLNGIEPGLFKHIQTASRFINQRFGNFIPMLATRNFQGMGRNLAVDPLLSVVSIYVGGVVLPDTDYELHPLNRHWNNGPYTRIYTEATHWDDDENLISGLWGKWDQLESLGINATQLIGAVTLTVSNGSILSIGRVIRVEDEQELIIGTSSPTALVSQLVGDITAADEQITIDNGTEVYEGEVIQISSEQIRIRMIVGNEIVVARGWNGTTKQAHLDNAALSVYRTYQVDRGINGTVPAAHADKAVSYYVPPEDVNWLARQIAGLMRMKAKSNFAGRVGNAETGETAYYNEFPGQIKDISKNYRIVSI